MARWAAFVDRDGTLVDAMEHLTRPQELRLLPGAARALRRLNEAGALVIVVTNQAAVARGLLDEAALDRIHQRLRELLAAEGARLDAIYYCPHHPETGHPEARDPRYRRDCDCRKPKTGMLRAAAERFGIELGRSFFIGDTTRDLQTAKNAGCQAVLVQTGYGGKDGRFDARADAVFAGLDAAAEWIVARAALA